MLSDKRETAAALEAEGLPVLPEIDPSRHDFGFELIGKPVSGWGGLGIQRAASLGDWQVLQQGGVGEGLLWQRELADFVEWSVDLALRDDGLCSRLVCRRRLRASGGFAVISEVTASAAVEKLAKQAAAWLARAGGHGLFNVQFLQEADGSIWLSDVNPRAGTSSGAALLAGVNLVEFLLGDAPNSLQAPQPGLAVRTLQDRFLAQLPSAVEGVVFDLDETLICQKSWMHGKLAAVLAALESRLAPAQVERFHAEALRLIDEGPWPQLIDLALSRSSLPAHLAPPLIELWRQAAPSALELHQDAWALARALQQRGIKLALLSDNPAASQRQKIALLPADVHFQSIVLTDELSAPKPDPRGFLAAAEGLGLVPERVLMVGDSPWRDALGALAAGYAATVLVQRRGSMSNPMRELFESLHGEIARQHVVWTESLFGIEHILEVP